MDTLERLKELYNRDFPADATNENNAEYKKFINDVLLVFPKLIAVVDAVNKCRAAIYDYQKLEAEDELIAAMEALHES